MTKREAAIISAYTGILIGNFNEVHAYAEEKFGGPIWPHQFASDDVAAKLKELARPDFINITITEEPS